VRILLLRSFERFRTKLRLRKKFKMEGEKSGEGSGGGTRGKKKKRPGGAHFTDEFVCREKKEQGTQKGKKKRYQKSRGSIKGRRGKKNIQHPGIIEKLRLKHKKD